jgi:hypothetical protein
MTKKVAAVIALIMIASLSVAGCTSNPLIPKPDYSTTFAKIMEAQTGGGTPINPISRLTDNVYSGSYRMWNANGSSITLDATIEIAQSEAAARERYGKLVL